MKLAALVEDFPPETDRIHLANGTLMLDGTFTEGQAGDRPLPFAGGLQSQRPHTGPLAGFFWMGCSTGGHPHLAGIYRLLPDPQQQGTADDGY